jgi:hypothetical protein
MRQMIGVLAELERSLTSERRGVMFGQKVKLTPEQTDHTGELIDKGDARQYVALMSSQSGILTCAII